MRLVIASRALYIAGRDTDMTLADESHPPVLATDQPHAAPTVAAAGAVDTGPAAPATSDPPKPRLTLRVGISGHRPKPEKFPQGSFVRVHEQLGATFAAIDKALEELRTSNAPFYAATPHKVRLVSGLAEGADQMAVDARPPGWDLDAILPFPADVYREDFQRSARDPGVSAIGGFETALGRATTIVQLPEDPQLARQSVHPEQDPAEYQRLRNNAYARLGVFLLHQVDVLVAVWDGRGEDGPGGTAEVIRRALDARIPVVWIPTLDHALPCLVGDMNVDGTPLSVVPDCLEHALAEAISTIVSVPPDPPPDTAAHQLPGPPVRARLAAFLDETWPKPSRSVTYDLFKRRIEKRPLRWVILSDSLEAYRRPWRTFIADAPDAGDLGKRIETVLMPRYEWADALAVRWSHLYRAAYVNCYLLAAFAVFLAMLGVAIQDLVHAPGELLFIKAVLVLLECVVIYLIVRIVTRGRRGRWQERWLEYRALAEMLRDARFLAYLGEHGDIQRPDDVEPASAAWFLWYMRATTREVGLPHGLLDRSYQETTLRAVETHVLDDQIEYHQGNARTLAHMHHALHNGAGRCFYVTALVLGLFLATFIVFLLGMAAAGKFAALMESIGSDDPVFLTSAEKFPEFFGFALYHVKGCITFCAAFFPALGAAFAGIRETGDFEGFAEHSLKTATALQDLKRQIPQIKRDLTLDAADDFLVATAQVLTEDLSSWRSVYGRKQLTLPA